ncbi:MAG TPA: NAD(P)-binding domain-containing protein, partial [Polyangiaceae bacterium LLY-WYZ-15_(1-7)]|nr:NAD(P)-binding domain-containing protein [Polyangiaceae bacterium LLY-WYZ-15_(1-7)]
MSEGRAPVAVVGGGGFGQGIARAAARQGLEVLLWSRSPRNLEGVKDTTSFVEVARAGLIFLAVPSPFVEAVAGEMGQQLDAKSTGSVGGQELWPGWTKRSTRGRTTLSLQKGIKWLSRSAMTVPWEFLPG